MLGPSLRIRKKLEYPPGVPRRYFFRGSFLFLCLVFLMLSRVCSLLPCGHLLGKDLALVDDSFCIFVTFPCGTLSQLWCLIVSFPGLCRLS